MSTDSGGFDIWSWLPFKFTIPTFAIPSFSIPGSIQGRFISFVLRRFIGHLFLPGQFDMKQIESQIGSGLVEITDLQLDPLAINAHLDQFPFRLTSGSVGKVRVRVPWPNPLTATVGFSISGLKLIFRLSESSVSQLSSHRSEGPVESVATIAEHFLHEELSLQEEAALRDTFHADAKQSASSIIESAHVPPGSMDPYTSRLEDDIQSEINESDIDPAGISIFASFIEKLLAKFDCDATDVEITLIYPEHASFIFRLFELSYRTEAPAVEPNSNVSVPRRETRSLRLTGITLSTRDLTPQIPTSPVSVQHSDSDVDETEDMSKSVFLNRSHTASTSLSASSESIASGMYRSALSASFNTSAHSPSRDTEDTVHDEKSLEDMVLSCASEPIVIELITPPSYILRSVNAEEVTEMIDETMSFNIRLGIIACAFRSSHIRNFLDLSDALSLIQSINSSGSAQNTNSSSRIGRGSVTFTIEGQGFTGLIISNPLVPYTDLSQQDMDQSMHRFFAKPHIPPFLPCDYIRICINFISLSYSMSSISNAKSNTPSQSMSAPGTNSISSIVTLAITDFSIITFIHSSEEHSQLMSFPLLVTDPQLISCYHSSPIHIHPSNDTEKDSLLPTFDIIDWIKKTGRGANNKAWRLKPSHLHSKRHSDVSKIFKDESQATSPNTAQFSRTVSTPPEVSDNKPELPAVCVTIGGNRAVVNVVPFQLSLDLEAISHFIDLCNDLISIFSSNQSTAFPLTSSPDKKDDPEKERRLLESQVLADLGLELDYGYGIPANTIGISNDRVPKPTAELNISVHIPLIRLQIRVPSPPSYSELRSGYLILDFHYIEAYHGPESISSRQAGGIRFTDTASTGQSDQLLLSILFSRLILAYALPSSSKANAIVSLGPFKQFSEKESPAMASKGKLLPSVVFQSRPPQTARNPSYPQSNVTTILINTPSLFVNLSKVYVDGIQLFADDISQWLERMSGSSRMEQVDSKNPSLIGSRFFARYTNSSSSSSTISDQSESELVITLFISDAVVRLILSSEEPNLSARFLDIAASDLDVLLELHPDRKDETVVTLNVNTINISQGQPTTVRSILYPSKLPLVLSGHGPLLQCRLRSFTVPGTILKQSQLKVTLRSFIFDFEPEIDWLNDLARFIKSPPGAFESVVPSERTRIQLYIVDGIIRALTTPERAAIVFHIKDIECSTELLDGSAEKQLKLSVPTLSIFTTDDPGALSRNTNYKNSTFLSKDFWRLNGCCLVAELLNLKMRMEKLTNGTSQDNRSYIDSLTLSVHICADSVSGITSFATEFLSVLQKSAKSINDCSTFPEVTVQSLSSTATEEQVNNNVLQSLDEVAFRRIPDVGTAPDMIDDDLPTNPVYLDTSFGAGDETVNRYAEHIANVSPNESSGRRSTSEKILGTGIISNHDGETIRMFVPSLNIIEHYYDTITPEEPKYGETSVRVRTEHCDLKLFLYEGYDWAQTRKTIEEETKKIRKRLTKIRQLLANGQNYEPVAEETGTLLFNSVYVGLDADDFEPEDLINAIDDELKEDPDFASETSWQSFKPHHSDRTPTKTKSVREGRLHRSRESSIEISLLNLNIEFDSYQPDEPLISRLLFTIEDLEILDHIKTSTWSKFLTELQSDIHGNIRETGSNMVKVELRKLHPARNSSGQEARLKAKLLPLRLYVDQDALDFLKKFFSFKQAETQPPSTSNDEIFFQHVEIFPVDIKLDYKPRRVDYRALREGRTIELMNFFHFDGAEMTLRHITLRGISGWARVFDTLNDLWTPDVKANQLMDVISGVSPIRSAVNVGSGVADLVLLPIAQYKKDGRIIRGMQKGAKSFIRTTGVEAIKIGAQLATGTQVILEGAENVLGGTSTSPITTEAIQFENSDEETPQGMYSESNELISKYADQPMNVREGVQSAYKTLSKNIKSAGQTILAVPMEIYESSSDGGPARAIVRAVPIAVLKPMIGASEAVSKTLLGLRNSLDPQARHENEAKYKRH